MFVPGLIMHHFLVEIQCSDLCSRLAVTMEYNKETQDENYKYVRMLACPGKFARLCYVYKY